MTAPQIAYRHHGQEVLQVPKVFATAELVQMIGGDLFAVSSGGQTLLYAVVGDPMDMFCELVASTRVHAKTDMALRKEGEYLAHMLFEDLFNRPGGNATD